LDTIFLRLANLETNTGTPRDFVQNKISYMKKYVKLSLSERSVESLLGLGNSVAPAMTVNAAVFPAPPVTPAVLQAAVDALTKSHSTALASRSKVDFDKERTDRAIVEDMLRNLGMYVDLVAKGVEGVIFKAGMPSSKTREKNPSPDQIDSLRSVFTGIPGTLELIWKRPKYGKMFRVYMTTTPEDSKSWKIIDTVATRRLMVQNLDSGVRFYFKVVAVNATGVSPDSEIANGLAA
jgi:hypothetical protein